MVMTHNFIKTLAKVSIICLAFLQHVSKLVIDISGT